MDEAADNSQSDNADEGEQEAQTETIHGESEGCVAAYWLLAPSLRTGGGP